MRIQALALAALGIYGVIAFSVAERIPEFGIRLALGAQNSDVLTLVLLQGARLIALGIGFGLLGAFGVARAMQSLLYGVTVIDLLTFVAVPTLLAVVALFACLIPARRATKVAPLTALRHS